MGCSNQPIIQSTQNQNFTCVAGDDFYEQLNLIDELTGLPIPIMGWQFYLDVFQSWAAKVADPDSPLISLVNGAGFTILSSPDGSVGMTILRSQTGSIDVPLNTAFGSDTPTNICVYDFVAIDENGLQRTRMRGNFNFTMRLTDIN